MEKTKARSELIPWRLVLPREHGAWAMFIVPLFLGIAVAALQNTGVPSKAAVPPEVMLFALTAFGFFLWRYPLMIAVKSRAPAVRTQAAFWGLVYGGATLLLGSALLLVSRQWLLIPIAGIGLLTLVVYLWLAARRAEMSTPGEWIGIAGLALGAPGAYLVGTGRFDPTALGLYFVNLIYFGGTVFYVRFKVREQPRTTKAALSWQQRLWMGKYTILYYVSGIALVLFLAWAGLVPLLAPLAFLPALAKVIGGVLEVPGRLDMRRLGLVEIGSTIAFGLLVLVGFL